MYKGINTYIYVKRLHWGQNNGAKRV